jgi:hypothetical protein
MTNLRARQVLDDCRLALAMLEDETDLSRWRVHWVAALALVRAVGHVLDKVDGEDDAIATLGRAAHTRWKSDAPEHEIFREFIQRERNTILKEYQFNVHPEDEVQIAFISTLRRVSDGALVNAGTVLPISDNIYRPLLEGVRQGDDARDVLGEAIDWWETELAAIERALGSGKQSP